jgi:hypothetical protein
MNETVLKIVITSKWRRRWDCYCPPSTSKLVSIHIRSRYVYSILDRIIIPVQGWQQASRGSRYFGNSVKL